MTTISDPAPRSAGDARVDAHLAVHLVRLGDDALVLGQRLCQWITRAPDIEEDLALSNIALDLIGQARSLFTLAGAADATNRGEDDFAFGRSGREFTNVLLTELPNGDFAATIARQLAYTHYAVPYYESLGGCGDPELAAFGQRAAKEVAFHRMHADLWVRRLGLGTAESSRRMQQGLDQVWPYPAELFEEDDVVRHLLATGTVPSPALLRPQWEHSTAEVIHRAGLSVPVPGWQAHGGRAGLHSEDFPSLVAELQSVHREFPGGTW